MFRSPAPDCQYLQTGRITRNRLSRPMRQTGERECSHRPWAFLLAVPDLDTTAGSISATKLGFRFSGKMQRTRDCRARQRPCDVGPLPEAICAPPTSYHYWFGYLNVNDVDALHGKITARGDILGTGGPAPRTRGDLVTTAWMDTACVRTDVARASRMSLRANPARCRRPSMSAMPTTSATSTCSPNNAAPITTAITGETNEEVPTREAPQSRTSRKYITVDSSEPGIGKTARRSRPTCPNRSASRPRRRLEQQRADQQRSAADQLVIHAMSVGAISRIIGRICTEPNEYSSVATTTPLAPTTSARRSSPVNAFGPNSTDDADHPDRDRRRLTPGEALLPQGGAEAQEGNRCERRADHRGKAGGDVAQAVKLDHLAERDAADETSTMRRIS